MRRFTILLVSAKTTEHHVTNILGKLGAANRREAAAIAVRHALV
jgi:DNA-binding NarL/FixJ family response regulator